MAVFQTLTGLAAIIAGFACLLNGYEGRPVRRSLKLERSRSRQLAGRRCHVSVVFCLTGVLVAVLGLVGLTEALAYTPEREQAITLAQRLNSASYMDQLMQEVTGVSVR